MTDLPGTPAPTDPDASGPAASGPAASGPAADITEPLGGALSGERDYVAANDAGVTAERHVPKGDEEIGKGSSYDPADERYPDEERGDS
ncbi:hypothetical protein [Frondihabitans cladoniiphilus]